MKKVTYLFLSIFLGYLLLFQGTKNTYAGEIVDPTPSEENFGIDMNTDCLLNGNCHFSIYDATRVRRDTRADGEETSAMTFLQDIIYGATFFIGTIVSAGIIVSGLLLVFSGANTGLKTKATNGLKYSLIGFVVVTLALVIIRLVQFLAKGGSS